MFDMCKMILVILHSHKVYASEMIVRKSPY
jgi:hypothetical protein